MKKGFGLLLLCMVLFGHAGAYAASGTPVKQIIYTKKTTLAYPATYTFRFSLWDSADSADPSGQMVWSDDNVVMTLNSAKVVYPLGSNAVLDGVDFSQQLWVQVDRWVKSKGSWKPVSVTRDRLGVVPYALWAEKSSVAASGSGITGVYGTGGLQGGGTSGDINLSIDFGGTGTAATAARSDHSHDFTADFVSTTGDTMTGNLVLNTGTGSDTTISEDKITRSGNFDIELTDAAADTTLNIQNSDTAYKANLSVEGNITAANFAGDGSGLTNINPAAHIHSDADVTFTYAGSASKGGPATTALALSSNGSNCGVGTWAKGIDQYGNAENCIAAVSMLNTGTGLTGGPITSAGTIDVNFGTAAGTVAAGDHAHNYDTNYVNVSGDTMTGDLATSGIVSSTGFRTGEYVIDATGIRTIRTNPLSNTNPPINIIPGTDDLPGLPGDINIKGSWAGNDSGGNVTVESGRTSPWTTSGGHSRATLAGGDISGRANTGSRIELQGGISAGAGSANVSGGSITIMGGTGNGSGSGGNIILLPGSGGTTGDVGIGTTTPTAKLEVAGTVKATAFSGDGAALTNINPAAHTHSGADITAGTVDTARLSVGTTAGTIAAGNHTHNYDSSYVNTAGDSMTGTFNVSLNLGGGNAITATNSGIGAASNAISAINTGTGHAGNFEITNAGSPNVALVATTNGSGNAIRAQTSGGGDALYSYTSGSGRAGLFQINNAANAGDAIYATTNGNNAAGNAVSGINTGLGHGGNFEINNTGSANVALVATTNGNGNALRAQAFGGGDTLYSYTTGSGKAGLFQVINAANSNDAVQATTNGTGHAGKFDITNAGSPNVSLHVTTIGSGNAVRAETSGGGDTLYSYTTGSGKAGLFQVINPASANDALYATTNGSGNAGRFDGKVTVSGTVTAGSFLGDGSGLTGSAPVAANNFATKGYVDSRIPNAILHVPFGMSCPAGFTKEFSGIISGGIYGQAAPLDVCTSSAYTLVVYIDAAQTCPVGWTQLDINTPVMGSVAADACYK